MKAALREHFRPEFLNRIDAQIFFNRLDHRVIRQIVELQLAQASKLLVQRSLRLDFDDAAKDLLGELGYDPAYGARPLKRAVREMVLEPLSELMIAGQVPPESCIQVRARAGQLQLQVESHPVTIS